MKVHAILKIATLVHTRSEESAPPDLDLMLDVMMIVKKVME